MMINEAFDFFTNSIMEKTQEENKMMNEKQQEIDMAEIDAINDLQMVRMIAELLGSRLLNSASPKINRIGSDVAELSQKAKNLLNEIRYE